MLLTRYMLFTVNEDLFLDLLPFFSTQAKDLYWTQKKKKKIATANYRQKAVY